jgi:nitroreductase
MEKPFPAERPILEILLRRWSGRAIDPDRPVSRAIVLTLIEAARVAPSSFNEQPWRFLLFDGSDGEALEQARSCLVEGNAWAKKAPALLLSVAAERWGKDGSPNRHAQHDVGLASENLALQAIAEGLVVHFMAGFDAERARELFGIPDGFTPMAMIAVGYPGDVEKLPPKLHDRELAPRRRKPIEEIAFAGTWDRPFTQEEAPATAAGPPSG